MGLLHGVFGHIEGTPPDNKKMFTFYVGLLYIKMRETKC